MPQELHILKCFSCEQFQSHIVKKTNKWVCKICGAKQSVKKEYGRGSGKDCRIHTQKLNLLRGVKEENSSIHKPIPETADSDSIQSLECPLSSSNQGKQDSFCKSSKWDQYIGTTEVEQLDDSVSERIHQLSDFQGSSSNQRSKVTKVNTIVVDTSARLKRMDLFDVTLQNEPSYKNTNFISSFGCDTNHKSSPPNKKRKPNYMHSDLKWKTQDSNTAHELTNIPFRTNENFNDICSKESREVNISSDPNQRTSACKMAIGSTDTGPRDEHTVLEYCKLSNVPVFEQSVDVNEIDIQLDF